jgi:serine/threonine-protein kinase
MAPQTHTTPMQMPEQRPQYHSQPPHAQSRMEATQMVRAPSASSNTALFVGLGLGVLGLAVAGILLFALPHSTKLGVTVVDAKGQPVSHAEVSVDGKKACDTSPCMVDSVSAGAHTVRVVAPGFEPAERAVTTEARKDSSIELMVTGGSGAKAGTGLKVAGSQPGVKLSIDGKDIGPLPQELHDLTPGEHKLRLAGSERYEPMEKTVTIAKDETLDLGPVSLKVMKGKATITLGTPGAKVYIVSGADRRDLPSFPISVDIDTSKSWALEAQKPGFTEYKQPISFADGLAEKVFNVELAPKSFGGAPAWTPPAGGGGTTASRPDPKPDPKPDPTTKPTTAAAATTKPETASTPAGEGTLNLNSLPASSVVLDGKPLGNTPKKGISVPAGQHTVIFVNAEEGLKKSMQVTVAAGETKTVIGKLRE